VGGGIVSLVEAIVEPARQRHVLKVIGVVLAFPLTIGFVGLVTFAVGEIPS
jgi:hypothetical protein